MRAQIGKWGNSLALRIPGHIAREIAIGDGHSVDISVESGRLVVVPTEPKPSYKLEELLAGITEENRHPEISTGHAVGNEFA